MDSSFGLLFSLCLSLLHLLFSFPDLVIVQAFTGTYGINYGRVADNIPSPENVVKLLKAAKIKNVRIYDADHDILEAFKGSGLELIVNIPNDSLKDMSANEDHAMNWVKENVLLYRPETDIRGIAVGNEVLAASTQEVEEALLGAFKNVYKAVKKLQLADVIEISTAHSEAVFANSYPPSSCTFKEDVMQQMKPLLQFLSQIGSPFFLNAYPFLAYKGDSGNIDLSYALFQSTRGIVDNKSHLHYDNMFDAQIDAAYAALDAAGFKNIEVRISETGWASNGDDNEAGATVQNAKIYNYNLRKRLALRKGTPLRPKTVVKAYIFALFNEDLKSGPTSERNFGLFKADGSIAYDIGFRELSSASSSLLYLRDIRSQSWLLPYSTVVILCAVVQLLVLMP